MKKIFNSQTTVFLNFRALHFLMNIAFAIL